MVEVTERQRGSQFVDRVITTIKAGGAEGVSLPPMINGVVVNIGKSQSL